MRFVPVRALAGLLAGAALTACAGAETEAVPSPDPRMTSGSARTADIPLVIRNRGTYDVTVYVHRAPAAPGRRVGTVNSGGSETFRIPEAELQAGRLLMLGVRAIAGRSVWVSPGVAVGTGQTARLDIMSDTRGDLSQTTLHMGSASP